MKIVKADNFDREMYSETLVAQGITYRPYGECMVKALNDKYSGSESQDYYKLVEDDYELYKFEP